MQKQGKFIRDMGVGRYAGRYYETFAIIFSFAIVNTFIVCSNLMVQKVFADDAMGISCGSNAEKLANGQCSFNIYKAVGIRQDQPDTTVGTFVQDAFLSGTFFIGTVVSVALIYSGIMYIMAKDDAAAGKAKNGIKYALIGLALVMLSYTIIRLVQYVAKG